MAIKKERFSEEKIEKLKKHLEFYHEKGQAIDFEIIIDGFKTVRRTVDPSDFDVYKTSIEEDTKEVTVRLFTGKSNNCDKIIFYLKEENLS
jgi:ferredoxin-fold anticodon binding domain-containing protein